MTKRWGEKRWDVTKDEMISSKLFGMSLDKFCEMKLFVTLTVTSILHFENIPISALAYFLLV